MPTIMTHALVGATLARFAGGAPLGSPLAIASAVCAMLPDADVAGFALGIGYGEMLGHRGLSHSIAFAVMAGGAAYAVAGRSWRPASSIALATASHGVLDALTNGGRGVAFLAPFSPERFFFPWTPIQVSPIGMGFFSARGASVFASELLWVWLPCLVLLLTMAVRPSRQKR